MLSKVRSVSVNNRKKAFEIRAGSKQFSFPFAKAAPMPTSDDPIVRIYVDKEIAREGFTYTLKSGQEGTIHIEQVLHYNRDPDYLRDMMLYRLSLEAQKRVESSGLSKREITRRLSTSAAQLYRLLDQTNYRKSIDQMLALLQVLDCTVELLVQPKASPRARAA